jgi:hypothetical protein
VFAIPALAIFLTKSRETKYDRFGNCVPFLPSVLEAQKKKRLKEEEIKLKKE